MTFRKGTSGNPTGRKPGALTTATKLRKSIEDKLPSILKKVVSAAENGDMAACRLLLDKCLPTPKSVSLPVTVEVGANLSETGGNIVKSTLGGEVPPDIGAALISALANQAKIIETDEILKRLTALEEALHDQRNKNSA